MGGKYLFYKTEKKPNGKKWPVKGAFYIFCVFGASSMTLAIITCLYGV